MLIRITPQIILVRPEGKTLYPYSNSLYINDNIKTIIDAGAGGNAYQEIAPDHIELLLLSHYHFDHINGCGFNVNRGLNVFPGINFLRLG
jgi:ribonuclease/clavin/mitogillin